MKAFLMCIFLHAVFMESCSGQIFKPFSVGALPFISKNTNLCSEDTQSSIVEDFFSTVFTEFLTAQPACVCIQLCLGQSTFCYPNGCFHNITSYAKNREDPATVPIAAPVSHSTKGDYQPHIDVASHEESALDRFYRIDTARKVTGSTNRPFSVRVNPFKDRFQLLSYLTYKRPKFSFDKYFEHDDINISNEMEPQKNVVIDAEKTQWPIENGDPQQSGEWYKKNLLKVEKNATEPKPSSSFDVVEKINSIEIKNPEKHNEEETAGHFNSSRFDKILADSFFSSNEDSTNSSASEKLKVLPVQKNLNTKQGAANLTDPKIIRKTLMPDSITQILVNATKEEDYYVDSTTRKSYLSRRRPLFDLRRLKGQHRRKGRPGNLQLARRKEARLLQRERNLYRRQLDSGPEDEFEDSDRDAGQEKRSDWRHGADMKIYIGDVEILNATVKNDTTSVYRTSPVEPEHTTLISKNYTNVS